MIAGWATIAEHHYPGQTYQLYVAITEFIDPLLFGMASSVAASESPTQRDSHIPLFTGAIADYREWRKRISLYYAKMQLSNRRAEAVINVVSTLTGAAWRLVEDFDVATADKEGTFESLLKQLDQHFEYDARVQLPADFDSYFGISRRAGQSLMEFVTLHNEHLKRLQKHKVDLPVSVQGWHLLRSCNLTREQRQLITLRAPHLEVSKVTEALYLVLGQDYKAAVNVNNPDRRGPGRPGRFRGYAAQDEPSIEDFPGYEDDEEEEWGYYGEEWGDEDEAWDGEPYEFDSQAGYYQLDEETQSDYADGPWDVEIFDEAFAAYM